MDIGVISVRYARALLKSATLAKLEDQVYQEMQTLSQSYIQVPELRFTIDNPMLAKDKKKAVLVTACGGEVTDLTQTFIQLVLGEDRESTGNRRTSPVDDSSQPLPFLLLQSRR